ncbi:ADAM 17-like protease [Condylostylus longicornis]|uniref:ADAM 17-like protease n=1 Tax=Condylostylus longicornis TaxID=2530218 RepID=UPI00244E5980|nr:ADAM 17-like protease [Condylostylus longicornis]
MHLKYNINIIFMVFLILQEASTLHKSLRHYETIHADQIQHKIIKRGTKHSSHPYNVIKEIEFKVLGKNFRLILNPHREVLHSNFRAYSVDKDGNETIVHLDHTNFYAGRVFGALNSSVRAHIEDGLVTGSIVLDDETYHIEPSWRHFPHLSEQTMVAYKISDVKTIWNKDHKHVEEIQDAPMTCGYIKEGLEIDQPGDEDDDLFDEFIFEEDDDVAQNLNYTINYTANFLKRRKRQADTYEYTPTKTRCPLLLVADYRFFQEMGGGNTKTTINYLISLIDRVHKIYNDTIWQDRSDTEGFKGMGFVIKKIVVHSEPTRVRGGEAHYNMIREKWDVRNLLEVFSREYSHKDFCLAHLFTDLKFEGGILGLAYVGSPRRNSVGGICTPEYFKNGYTLYLNSGLSSSRNHYGQRVITREADLVTAHEFGHNWGSEHDPDIPECSPSASQGGSFLMYTYSVSGYDVNNKKFSPCSLRSIRKVLQAKSGRCFSEPEESFCGNLRVEGDEQCDAGLLGTEDNDACCDKNCKLRRAQGAVCSDKNSPCCQNCQFMPVGHKCREAQYATCEQEARCTGAHAECPKSPPMADGTVCQEKGQCRNGKCVPYCETQGLQSCMCDIILDACKRCCRMSINETCFPVEPPDVLPDGTPCIQGFCNKGVCEKTIQDVVERFWDIIEEININKVLRFLKDNIVMAIVVLTSIFWIPASCVVSYFDRKKMRREMKNIDWCQKLDLIHPNDRRRVIHIRVPRQKIPMNKLI